MLKTVKKVQDKMASLLKVAVGQNVNVYIFSNYNSEGSKRYGLMDSDFNVVLENKYQILEHIGSNRFLFKDENYSGMLNHTGEILLESKYHIDVFQERHAVFTEFLPEGKYACGLIRNDGVIRVPAIYDAVKFDPNIYNIRYALVKKDGKFGIVAKQGGGTILETIYDEVKQYMDDCFIVKYNGLYGVVRATEDNKDNLNGTFIVEPKCGNITIAFNRKFGSFRFDAMYGIIDKQGNIIEEAIFDNEPVIGNDDIFYIPKGDFKTYYKF